MHNLSSAFVLGYHGCDAGTAEKLLLNMPFETSRNNYDWLGSGIYFWEANPDRALSWARETGWRRHGRAFKPAVVGAVIDLGFCLDLISSNGIQAVEWAHERLVETALASGITLPLNEGGDDLLLRRLDCAVIEFLHLERKEKGEPAFDTVRAVFPEATPLYEGSGFRRKTHIQLCVRNHAMIKGVFRVPKEHFTGR